MRKTGISLQIFGGLMCAAGGMGASFYFERYIMMMGKESGQSLNDVVATGLEIALVALLVTGVGAFLIIYGGRVAKRAAAPNKGSEA